MSFLDPTSPAGGTALLDRPQDAEQATTPWVCVVWNDPVNTMTYVAYIFETYFGYPRTKAERLMLQVHRKGRAAVAEGSREQMETHVTAMHNYGLQSTVEHRGH